MCPSMSAYTKFCAGTSSSRTALRNDSKSAATLTAKIASMAWPGFRAVHASETPYPSRRAGDPLTTGERWPTCLAVSRTSLSRGPCTVDRTVMVTGAAPATAIVSVRVCSGSNRLSRR
jgi:hypothetical protein